MMSYRDPYIYDGVGRNPYDLYDGGDEAPEEEPQEERVRPIYVVYCKDCRFRDVPFQWPSGCKWHPDEVPDDDDFCSWGETKDGQRPQTAW